MILLLYWQSVFFCEALRWEQRDKPAEADRVQSKVPKQTGSKDATADASKVSTALSEGEGGKEPGACSSGPLLSNNDDTSLGAKLNVGSARELRTVCLHSAGPVGTTQARRVKAPGTVLSRRPVGSAQFLELIPGDQDSFHLLSDVRRSSAGAGCLGWGHHDNRIGAAHGDIAEGGSGLDDLLLWCFALQWRLPW